MSFDEEYRNTKAVFGAEPETILTKFDSLFPANRSILDVGAGQGRNTFHLARNGLHVDAIDPSSVGMDTIAATASRESLPIQTFARQFDAFPEAKDTYGGVLLFGLLQILSWDAIDTLRRCVDKWLATDGLVFVTCFTTEDPSYSRYSQQSSRIGPHSYSDEAGDIRTFLEPGQIADLFASYTVIHQCEAMSPEHHHGDGILERHAMAEAIWRK